MLRFEKKKAEQRFLLFIAERPAMSTLVFMLLLLAFDTLVTQNTSRPFDDVSNEFDVIHAIISPLYWVLCIVCAVVVALARFREALFPAATLRLVMDVLYSVFVLMLLIGGYATRAEGRQNDCNTSSHSTIKDANKKVYADAACHRNLSTIVVCLMSTLVIKRIRFDVSNFSYVFGSAMTIATVIAWPLADPWALGVATVIFTTTFFMFLNFLRYIAEKRERQYFLTQERMQEIIDEAERSTSELQAFIDKLLPPLLVERSGVRGAVHKIDSTKDAVVLIVNMANFMEYSQTVRPIDAARCIEQHRTKTSKLLLETSTMTRVSVFLDEVVAVGNLLSSTPIVKCVSNACSVALSTTRDDSDSVQVKAVVHLGEVRGGFSGKNWVRYDIWGPGVETARSMVQLAGPGQTLVSDEVVHVARDMLDVREGPAQEGIVVDGDSGGSEQSSTQSLHQYWVVDRCDESGGAGDDWISSPSMTQKVSESSSDLSAQQSPAAQLQTLMTDRAELGRQLEDVTHRKWCIFREFDDGELEERYAARRREGMAAHAAKVWMAYAAFLAVHVVVVVVDLFEPQGVGSVVGLIVSTLLAAVSASLTSRFEGATSPATHWMLAWAMLSFFGPLLAVFSAAASRPSALGMDLRQLQIGSVLAQTAGFLPAHRQMVLTIVFALVSTLHFFALPGGVLYSAELIAIVFIVFICASDAETDLTHRANFLSECRIEDALKWMKVEEAMRTGLSRAIVPTPILEHFSDNQATQLTMCTAPDTVVVYVTVKARETVGFDQVEAAIAHSKWLDVVTFNGDSMLLMTPVVATAAKFLQRKSEIMALGETAYMTDILAFCMALNDNSHRVIVECETTQQLVGTEHGMPRYSVIGIGITRTLAIASTADDVHIRSGVLVTEGVHRLFKTLDILTNIGERELPRWRIRGVGVLRMTELKS